MTASRRKIPEEILSAAHDRARARRERDWPEADRLRDVIEAAGWKIVDRGTDFALAPAAAPTVEEMGGVVRYGSSRDVPSRLDEPSSGLATVIFVATDWPDDVDRAITGLAAHSPEDVSIVVVADGASAEQEAALATAAGASSSDVPANSDVTRTAPAIEVVRTAERLGQAAALNAGFRRASGQVVIVLDASVEPTGDIVGPLVRALDDPTVGVAGGWGVVSDNLRQFREAPAGDVDAIEGYALAFRREDAAGRGPLDEHFRFYRNLDIWWSLVLRDEGEGHPPRRAVAVDLPAIRHEHRGWTAVPEAERERLSKRNFYRIIDRFGWRLDLARPAVTSD
jgi:cellulose synthase/poly-beta-1,6-N-acetylglucosamine synthase-like glycosyltransferase